MPGSPAENRHLPQVLLSCAWSAFRYHTLYVVGLAVLSINLGSIVSSLAGPAIIDDPAVLFPVVSNSSGWNHSPTSHTWVDVTMTLRTQIGNFMFFHFLLALIVLVLVIGYFPSRPDIPPETAKSVPRLKPMDGLRVALK